MIWFILYMVGAAGSVFTMTYLTAQMRYVNMDKTVLFAFGLFWPIMAPIYIAYALARIMADR